MAFFTFVVIVQNNSESVKKTSVIGLPKFTIVNMAENCHQPTSFSKENMFFENYFFGSQMFFFNGFSIALYVTKI